jgi:hypothetical protein
MRHSPTAHPEEPPIRIRTATIGVVAAVVVAVGAAACDLPDVGAVPEQPPSSGMSSSSPPRDTQFTLAAPVDPESLTVPEASYSGWALLDRRTGQITGSANAATRGNTVESMIKPWIVADFLRQETEQGNQLDEETLDELTLMIVDSNDPLAEKYYQIGGADAVLERMEPICGIDLTIEPTLWGMARMTPMDAVRYGACLADGRAAGPEWTPWILDAMRHVRGDVYDQDDGDVQGGRWGIVDGLPPSLARETSFKNGWTLYEDGWHVNCLAVHADWVLSVMMRMPYELPVAAEGCQAIAAALVVDRTPDPPR